MGFDNKNKLTKTALGHFPAQKAEKGIIMENLELQKKAELLEALVNDLCEETSAEQAYEYLLTLGMDIGITDKDLKDWGFNPFEDEEDVEYDVALGCNEDDYVLASNGNIEIKKSLVYESFRKVGKELRVWFVDEDDPLHIYRVVEVTDNEVIAEFID